MSLFTFLTFAAESCDKETLPSVQPHFRATRGILKTGSHGTKSRLERRNQRKLLKPQTAAGKLSQGCIQTNKWTTQSGTHKHSVIPHQAIFICSIYEHNITAHNINSKRICTSLANTVLHCGLDGQKYVTSERNDRKEVQSAISKLKWTKTPFLDNKEVSKRQIMIPLSAATVYPNTSKLLGTLKLRGILKITYLEMWTQQV